MDTETTPIFQDSCPKCGGCLEQVPDAPVMLSYPALYYVKCRRCGKNASSCKRSEVEEARKRYLGVNKDTPIVEVPGETIFNIRALDLLSKGESMFYLFEMAFKLAPKKGTGEFGEITQIVARDLAEAKNVVANYYSYKNIIETKLLQVRPVNHAFAMCAMPLSETTYNQFECIEEDLIKGE